MADSELPLDSAAPFYEMGTVIDGVSYWFNMKWNGREECWYFDLWDTEKDPIISGIKIVLGALLGRNCTDPRFPNGAFFASDLSGAGRDATIDDLGVRVKLYFRPAADFS